MDNQRWDLDFIYNGPQSIRVSCHPGDHGERAFCNMIGDQPLFYIDDSADDEIFDEIIEASISLRDEQMIADMQAKLKAYDRSARVLGDIKMQSSEDQFDSAFSRSKGISSLNDILQFAEKSGHFKTYYSFINEQGIEIVLNSTIQTEFYDREQRKIFLNQNLDINSATISLMRAMRMAWNHKRGVLINPLAFQPEEAILVNRILEADLAVAVVALLWDLKLAGETSLWNNAMSGSDYDICAAYAMEAMTDFRSIKSGLAARATFEKWFISGRCKSFDRQIIQTMLGKHTDIVISHQEASKKVALDLIVALGQRPEGNNYLSLIANQIIEDGLFRDVRDRSNANFLWFVSFERRMEEVEQELQEDQSEGQANVITLPHHDKESAAIEGDHIASIFFIDHFRAG